MADIGVDAACGHQQRLRGGNAIVLAKTAGAMPNMASRRRSHLVDDVVDTGQPGIHLSLAAVVDQPLAKDVAAGEVNRLDAGAGHQLARGFLLRLAATHR